MNELDVAIVGGSIGGATAGYLLGSTGKSIGIFEPAKWPRFKPCGEGLNSIGVDLLRQSGLWTDKLENSTVPFYGYSLRLADRPTINLRTNRQGIAAGVGIERSLLDRSLVQAASEVAQIIPSKVIRFKRSGEAWEIESTSGSYRANELIFAWGSDPKIRNMRKKEGSALPPRPRYGLVYWFKGYWKGPNNNLINIYPRGELQYLLTPVSTSTLNVSVLVARSAQRKVSNKVILETAREIVEGAGFVIEQLLFDAGASEIHSVRQHLAVPGAYYIGDALERYDPIGGMGMTNAISSAMLIAKLLNKKFHDGGDWAETQRTFLKLHRRQSWHFSNQTRLSFSTLVDANPGLIGLIRHFPSIGTKIMEVGRTLTYRNCIGALGKL